MTTEFEHQEELETVLTEEPTGEPTPAPEAEVEKLGEAAVSLEWLVSLQRTISKEGVSSLTSAPLEISALNFKALVLM